MSGGAEGMPVVYNLALASLLQRDPERPSFTWTADDDVDIERITRQCSLPMERDRHPKWGSRRRWSGAGNSRWGPRMAETTWLRLAWTGPVVTGDSQEIGVDPWPSVSRVATPAS